MFDFSISDIRKIKTREIVILFDNKNCLSLLKRYEELVIHDFLTDSHNKREPTKFSSTCYIGSLK